jgi:hypothetical protein
MPRRRTTTSVRTAELLAEERLAGIREIGEQGRVLEDSRTEAVDEPNVAAAHDLGEARDAEARAAAQFERVAPGGRRGG